jgi:class 3 adenylate cyclase
LSWSVAFVDIIGSTGIADRLAPDLFFDLLNEYFAVVDVYATFYRGTIY